MTMCQSDLGAQSEKLVSAMCSFCDDMGCGKICGTLAAAVAAIYVADPVAAQEYQQEELMEWFFSRYGGYDCCEIIQGDFEKKMNFCPRMVVETYEKVQEYLRENKQNTTN
jgi:hypothetical protein